MNVKKYPQDDPLFYEKVRGACLSDWERGLVYILQHTGMHLSCLMALRPDQMDEQNDIRWRRTKTGRPMKQRIPKGDADTVRRWIAVHGADGPKNRTTRWARATINSIGERAGFPQLSAMTFRAHLACVLLDEGVPPHRVKHRLGCSLEVLMENYAQLESDRRASDG